MLAACGIRTGILLVRILRALEDWLIKLRKMTSRRKTKKMNAKAICE